MNNNMCLLSKTDGICYVTSLEYTVHPGSITYRIKYRSSAGKTKTITGSALTMELAQRLIKPRSYFEDEYPELFL